MSTPAISNLIAAIGGKGTLPSLENLLPGNGLPLDFAAILAEQALPAGEAAAVFPASEVASTGQFQLPTLVLKEITARATTTKNGDIDIPLVKAEPQAINNRDNVENAAIGVLAAISSSAKQPVATIAVTETEKIRERGDPDRKIAEDSLLIPGDPGPGTQYAPPLVTALAERPRPPEGTDGDNSTPTSLPINAGSDTIAAKEYRPGLKEQAPPVISEFAQPSSRLAAQQSAPLAEPHTPPRSDAANTAILAGEANPGNSGNTPAVAMALAATSNANGSAMPVHQKEPPAIATPLGQANWSHDFGNRIVWMAKNDQQVAQININPPQLGPVQISISLSGDQASATFASPHPEVRQVIQDSLPQLREMLSSAGISLGQANVGTQLPSQNREGPYQFANEARSSGENAILSPDNHSSNNQAGLPILRGRGLVDLFA